MINSEIDLGEPAASHDEAVGGIVRSGAGGAIVLTAVATAIVIAIWFAFYLLVFMPRASAP